MTPPPIRGLTLRHPWPRMFLLDDDPKRIENREWAPPSTMLGQLIALHGGLPPRPGDRDYFKEIRQALTWVGDVFDDPDPVDTFTDEELLSGFCVTGIFAVARLATVVMSSDDPWFIGPFGWVLDDVVPIDPPVIDRSPSHRGLWVIEDGTLAELRRRYREATGPPVTAPEVPVSTKTTPQMPLFEPTVPAAFCPGRPLPAGRARLEHGVLYGCAAGSDWVTVIRQRDGSYHWRQLRGPEVGHGTRAAFEAWLATLEPGRQTG